MQFHTKQFTNDFVLMQCNTNYTGSDETWVYKPKCFENI